MQLRSMSIDKLLNLKEQVDQALSSKVVEARRILEAQLSRLTGFGKVASTGRRGAMRGTIVAPKYRNPVNPSETWAGRGLKPRWLVAALKTGKKLEYFNIDKSATKPTKKVGQKKVKSARKGSPRKGGRPRKAAIRRPAAIPSTSGVASAEA